MRDPHVLKKEVRDMKNPSPATVMIACEELVTVARRGGWSLENVLEEIQDHWREMEEEEK